MFFPISLKRKKPDILFQELKRKQIKRILDVRRKLTPYSSAKYYQEDPFFDLCQENNIEYIRAEFFSNRFKVKTSQFYIADPRVDENLDPALEDHNGDDFNVGVVCYCTEEAQGANLCHASWLCNYLNKKLQNTD